VKLFIRIRNGIILSNHCQSL